MTSPEVKLTEELHQRKRFGCNHSNLLPHPPQGPVASASAAPPSAPAGGCPPPPPPGPPPPSLDISGPASGGGDAAAGNRNALFAAINKGSDITRGRWYCVQKGAPPPPPLRHSRNTLVRLIIFLTFPGLKHVSDDEKTHKNPALRGQAAQIRTGPKPFCSPTARSAPSATPTCTLPPVLELDGKKWKVVRRRSIYTKTLGDESSCEGRRSLFRLIYVFCRRTKRGCRTW